MEATPSPNFCQVYNRPADTRIVIGTWQHTSQPEGDWATIYVNHRDTSVRRGSMVAHLSRERLKMLAIVLAAEIISDAEFYHAMWCDRDDGGPDGCRHLTYVNMHYIRRSVNPLGIDLIRRWGIGLEAVIT